MTTGTPITSTLNITQDDVVRIVRRIIDVDGLEEARAAFKQMNEFFSGMEGWTETTDAVYDLLAEHREAEQQRLRKEKLEEQRAGAPLFVVSEKTMTSNMNEDDGFCIKVYSPGNFIAKEITINGGVHLGNNPATGGFTDEQIARALAACVGKGKVIDNKQKWAGAYWYLRWACWITIRSRWTECSTARTTKRCSSNVVRWH